jgi:helicase
MAQLNSPAPGAFRLTPPQQEVVDRGLLDSGFSCVLQMPTGSGKTWLAEQAMARVIEQGRRAVYLTPLRALGAELHARWASRFGAEVGLFTGETSKKETPASFSRASILIMTPERLDACTRSWRSHWSWIPDVDLLVVDEFHLLGDRQRGPRLEGTLLRFQRLNPFTRVLGLSATLGNRAELADWLEGVEYESTWRSVPLEWRVVRYRKATEKPDLLAREAGACVKGGGKSLVFTQSRRRAESLAAFLSTQGLRASFHHAGLQQTERATTESKFRRGETDVLVATGTLEMGMNFPVRQVVLYDLQYFDSTDFKPLPVTNIWQRAGRAGRPGLDDRGEAVLLAPTWDREVDSYLRGRFEPVRSGLACERALAEQVLAEVASGLCRTEAQLESALSVSLAGFQGRSASVRKVVATMTRSGMLTEVRVDDDAPARPIRLKATRLGHIAVRQMLSPDTVLHLARIAALPESPQLTFLDLLLVAASTVDCQPLIPAGFEELEALSELLEREPSLLLAKERPELETDLGCTGRRLLAVLKTALCARLWTRSADASAVSAALDCYPFEILRLRESLERILTALLAIESPQTDPDGTEAEPAALEPVVSLREKVRVLLLMLAHGLDEEAVTLSFVPGLGGVLARRLEAIGIGDIEALALADFSDVASVKGISEKRARAWVAQASEIVQHRSALSFREEAPAAQLLHGEWPSSVDPYRLRRAADLRVTPSQRGIHIVTGGLEPHQVEGAKGQSLRCDCADFARVQARCKHVLAVQAHQGDEEVRALLRRLATAPPSNRIDLTELWLSGARGGTR